MSDTEALADLLAERDRLRQLNELQAATIERQADSIQRLMEQSERRKEYADRLRADVRELVECLRALDEAYCRAGSWLTKAERHQDRTRLMAARALLAKHKETT